MARQVMILRSTEAHGSVVVRIVVPRETAPGERRVALVPESCKKLIQAGYEIAIEAGAGERRRLCRSERTPTSASAIVADPASLFASGDLVLKVTAPGTTPGATKPRG